WGIFLTLITTASAQGLTLEQVGGSLAIGVMLAGVITVLIGISGLAPMLARFFTPGVMGVFMLLLGFTLIQIFLKGMLGIPFDDLTDGSIAFAFCGLGSVRAVMAIIVSIKSPVKIRTYSLLIGFAVGWRLYVLFFGCVPLVTYNIASMKFFPFGSLY